MKIYYLWWKKFLFIQSDKYYYLYDFNNISNSINWEGLINKYEDKNNNILNWVDVRTKFINKNNLIIEYKKNKNNNDELWWFLNLNTIN